MHCVEASREHREPLAGTAPVADKWLLLEYNGAWGGRALEESDLSPAVKQWLQKATRDIPRARLLLIRQERRSGPLRFFCVRVRDQNPYIHSYTLDTADDLLKLDLQQIAGGLSFAATREAGPLLLVCTNGRRDACCARLGNLVYKGLREHLGDRVWQCTHLGGHRFAANVFTFPSGFLYGRVGPEDVPTLVEHIVAERVPYGFLRGRTHYPPAVQAAEAILRAEQDINGPMYLVDQTTLGDTGCKAQFIDVATQQPHDIQVRRAPLEVPLPLSCGAEPESVQIFLKS